MPLEIVRNDMTKMKVDAIVDPTDRGLSGGGGLDGAIHRAAGPGFAAECRSLGRCGVGEAKITKGGLLPAKYVIHTVGPVWHGGNSGEREQLSSCYRSALDLAKAHGCGTLAFPLISAGTYGYPKDEALSVALDVISRFLLENDMTVYLVVFGRTEYLTSKKLFRDVQEYIDDVYAASHYANNLEMRRRRLQAEYGAPSSRAPLAADSPAARKHGLDMALKTAGEGFSAALLRLIDEKGLTDAQCYNRANIDKRLFSMIRSNPAYQPSKPTVFAFAVALELSLPETIDLLGRAGFALSHSSRFDIIMEYFIQAGFYDVHRINQVLFDYDAPLLGSGTKQ